MDSKTTSQGKIYSLTPPILNNWSKEELFEYFKNSWELNDILFESITDDSAFYTNPDPLRNPLIFYLGHTAAFCINKLKAVGLIENGINEHFEKIFEIGVDPETEEDIAPDLSETKWPTVTEVWAYRQKTYNLVSKLIKNTTLSLNITWDSPLWALLMGLEHDRIHFETSTMLLRQLDEKKLKKPEKWAYSPMNLSEPKNEMIEVLGGELTLGKRRDHQTYGWDNEYGELKVKVEPFQASKYLITNKEYFEFVDSGAFNEEKYWGEHAWMWKESHNVKHPKFWIKEGDNFKYRALFDDISMPWDWPVEVNHYEAMAYCRWKGKGTRLLSESEWNLISNDHDEQRHDIKNDPMFSKDLNLNMEYGSPTPVGFVSSSINVLGFADIYGNVWEWVNDDFYPLPGFETHTLYKNFSIAFFDTFHAMMLGGSWASTGTSASKYYRLWFRRYFYQHAGFRIAKNIV
jgi:5-histidylcysteine sulfoxide synthase